MLACRLSVWKLPFPAGCTEVIPEVTAGTYRDPANVRGCVSAFVQNKPAENNQITARLEN